MKANVLDDLVEAPADPGRDPAAGISSLMPEVPLPIGPGARPRLLAAGGAVEPRFGPLGMTLVALLWALIVGLASTATSSLAVRKASPPSIAADEAATAVRVRPASPVHVARLRSGSILRSHKRPPALPRIAAAYDPNDDATSDDPDEDDDDETSKFLDGPDDTDGLIIAWHQEMMHFLIAPDRAPVAWVAPFFSPLLTLQRLRC
jgi:hypothetical protein